MSKKILFKSDNSIENDDPPTKIINNNYHWDGKRIQTYISKINTQKTEFKYLIKNNKVTIFWYEYYKLDENDDILDEFDSRELENFVKLNWKGTHIIKRKTKSETLCDICLSKIITSIYKVSYRFFKETRFLNMCKECYEYLPNNQAEIINNNVLMTNYKTPLCKHQDFIFDMIYNDLNNSGYIYFFYNKVLINEPNYPQLIHKCSGTIIP